MTHNRTTRSMLRAAPTHGHHRVTFVELFFDLVFVFAITQISHSLLEHFSLLGVIETMMLLLAVWWVWIYTSWTTNWLDPDKPPIRLLLFALMLLGLVMSTSIPKAFESRGLAFALALVAMQIGRTSFVLLWVRRDSDVLYRSFLRILSWLVASGFFWIAGGAIGGGTQIGLWGIAIAIDLAGPLTRYWTPWLGASTMSDWKIEGGHMAERCALFIIIALGESLLVTGATFAKSDWNAATIAAFIVAFIGSLAMWWIYFDKSVEDGSARISQSEEAGRLGRLAYTYLHLPIVAGVIVAAVSDEQVLAHPGGHLELKTAIATIGGPLLFLIGAILFKHAIRGWLMLSHMAGIAALLVLAPFYGAMSPLTYYSLTTLILCVVAGWETLSLKTKEN